jgi:ubiquinone/menaquinone biosynthesis C-methylase UbiE
MTLPLEDVQKHYDRWAPSYMSAPNPTRDLNARVLREQIPDPRGRILEIGCGTGINTAWLAERATAVIALDFSDVMLAEARKSVACGRAEFIPQDVTDPWQVDGGFDLVVATLVLEHVANLRHIFTEAHRVLTPGGRLYIAELHPYKQLKGSQARYDDPATGSRSLVPAFAHQVSEYVNAGLETGLRLLKMGEWRGVDDPIPRLLSLWFER